MKTTSTVARWPAFGMLAALLLLGSGTAAAQQSRSLRIENGDVYIDNQRVAEDELPDGLEIEGVTAVYTFSGDLQPVVRLGNQFYVLDGDRLRVAERESAAFFQRPPRIQDFVPPDVRVQFRGEPDVMEPPTPPHAVVFDQKARALRQQAQQLAQLQQNLQQHFREQQAQELRRLAQEMSLHASEAAQMASELPRIELETYLEDVRRQNEGLFDQLVSERDLEHRTIEMARQIRGMSESAGRREHIEALRAQLDEIFELKQENRRREMEQLERRLESLEQRLAERERMREEIVERRLRDLLGDEMEW